MEFDLKYFAEILWQKTAGPTWICLLFPAMS